MSSGFVSAGTNDAPTERDAEWYVAQAEIENARRRKEEAQASHQEHKSLYEVLQQNKAAKQDAFEEAQKLRNQFRSLEEDEVEFLDEVLESTRREESTIKQQTKEQLEAFRRQQSDADRAASNAENDGLQVSGASEETFSWGKGGKRKRKEASSGLGIKKRRESSTQGQSTANKEGQSGKNHTTETTTESETTKTNTISSKREGEVLKASVEPDQEGVKGTALSSSPVVETPDPNKETAVSPSKAVALGLGGYSSDEDD